MPRITDSRLTEPDLFAIEQALSKVMADNLPCYTTSLSENTTLLVIKDEDLMRNLWRYLRGERTLPAAHGISIAIREVKTFTGSFLYVVGLNGQNVTYRDMYVWRKKWLQCTEVNPK
jgi:hypothetical protein